MQCRRLVLKALLTGNFKNILCLTLTLICQLLDYPLTCLLTHLLPCGVEMSLSEYFTVILVTVWVSVFFTGSTRRLVLVLRVSHCHRLIIIKLLFA